MTVGLDDIVHVFPLEPAVASGAQATDRKQPPVGLLPHRVGMDTDELSYLGGGQHH
jgi:hypothetical protein